MLNRGQFDKRKGENMRTFRSEAKYEIKGRGTVFTLVCPEEIPKDEVLKKEIKVDGQVYVCEAIERFVARLDHPTLARGERVGLLVSKV